MIIFRDHNLARPIGKVEMVGDRLEVTFIKDVEITEDDFFKIFGDCSFMTIESGKSEITGHPLIKKATILEFSLSI